MTGMQLRNLFKALSDLEYQYKAFPEALLTLNSKKLSFTILERAGHLMLQLQTSTWLTTPLHHCHVNTGCCFVRGQTHR